MNVALVALGLGLLLALSALGPLSSRLSARTAVVFARTGATSGLALLILGIIATAAPLLVRWVGLGPLTPLCERVFGHVDGDNRFLGVAAIVAVLVIAWRLVVGFGTAWRRQRHLYIEETLGEHAEIDGTRVVVLDTTAHLAYTVPGSPPQIVISRGLREQLSPYELAVVLAHEKGHVDGGHPRDLSVIEGLGRGLSWIPGMRSALLCWRATLERAADDVAARRYGRTRVAATVRRMVAPVPGVLGFGSAERIADRLDYLRRPGRSRLSAVAIGVVLYGLPSIVGLVTMWTWMVHAHEALAVVAGCPL